MKLTGLHLLLTYKCNYECDHCFVRSGPYQQGVMTLKNVRHILAEARDLGTVNSIYFEGGEPFLYYAVMLKGIEEAAKAGFKVGIVTNNYWATEKEDALEWLRPLTGLVSDLAISTDLYHADEMMSLHAKNAVAAALELGISSGAISIDQPIGCNEASSGNESEVKAFPVRIRGRAVEKLAHKAEVKPWDSFTECPDEDFFEPGRLHVDPFGNLFICQGLNIGNIYSQKLSEIIDNYDPDTHPVIGPLIKGGPAELVRRYNLPFTESYADACHLCFISRSKLMGEFPDAIGPEQVYGGDDQ